MKKIIYLVIFILSCFSIRGKTPVIVTDSSGKVVYETDNSGNIIKKGFFTFKYDDSGRIIALNDGDLSITYAYNDTMDGSTDVKVVFRENGGRRDFSYRIIKKETPSKKIEEIHGPTVAFHSGTSQNKLLFSKETLLDDDRNPFEVVEKEYVRRVGKDPNLYFMKYPVIRKFTRKIPARTGGWSEISYTTNEEGYNSVKKGETFVNYITEAVYRPQSFINGEGTGVTVKIYNPNGRLDVVENNGRKFLYKYFYKNSGNKKHIDKLEIINSGIILETLYYKYPKDYDQPDDIIKDEDKEIQLSENEEIAVVGNFQNIDLSEDEEISDIVETFQKPIYKKETHFRINDR